MPTRSSEAEWKGNLARGSGTMSLGSGAFEGAYSFASRFEDGEGTNPEELIAAAHAGCFSMALSGDLGRAGYEPEHVETTATVHLELEDSGPRIARIVLDTRAKVAGVSDDELREIAAGTKDNCPVSKALAAVETIEVNAELVN